MVYSRGQSFLLLQDGLLWVDFLEYYCQIWPMSQLMVLWASITVILDLLITYLHTRFCAIVFTVLDSSPSPLSTKFSLYIQTLSHRASTMCSNPEFFSAKRKVYTSVVPCSHQMSIYPKWALDKVEKRLNRPSMTSCFNDLGH